VSPLRKVVLSLVPFPSKTLFPYSPPTKKFNLSVLKLNNASTPYEL